MEVSKYNVDFNLDDKYVIYNLSSKKFVMCSLEKKFYVFNLLNKLNQLDMYLLEEEKNVLKKMAKQGIIVNNTQDEIEKIKYLFNKTKYQEGTFILVISPTIKCNFGCSYCFETRRDETWDQNLKNNLIKFVEDITPKVKTLQVSWFGGEPTLEYDNIKIMTKKFKSICEKNKCNYISTITTNGYLLNDERINELESLGICKVQITIDGDEKYHNEKRPLNNGEETFQKIFENILKISEKDIMVILRINLDDKNKDSIIPLLKRFPEESRKNIIVNICNIFQNKNTVRIYDLCKKTIELGFICPPFRSDYSICEGSFVNSITVNPNGEISPCQMCIEEGLTFGELTNKGSFRIKDPTAFYRFRNSSPFDNDKCIKCKYLPMCLGGCSYQRYKDLNICDGEKILKQISIEEIAKLAVYNQMKNGTISAYNVI